MLWVTPGRLRSEQPQPSRFWVSGDGDGESTGLSCRLPVEGRTPPHGGTGTGLGQHGWRAQRGTTGVAHRFPLRSSLRPKHSDFSHLTQVVQDRPGLPRRCRGFGSRPPLQLDYHRKTSPTNALVSQGLCKWCLQGTVV